MFFCWSFLCRRPGHDSQAEHGAGLGVRSVNASPVSLSWQSVGLSVTLWMCGSLAHWLTDSTVAVIHDFVRLHVYKIKKKTCSTKLMVFTSGWSSRRCWIICLVKILDPGIKFRTMATSCKGFCTHAVVPFRCKPPQCSLSCKKRLHILLELKQLSVAIGQPYLAFLAVSFPSRCTKSRSRDQKHPRFLWTTLRFVHKHVGGKLSAKEYHSTPSPPPPTPHPHPHLCPRCRSSTLLLSGASWWSRSSAGAQLPNALCREVSSSLSRSITPLLARPAAVTAVVVWPRIGIAEWRHRQAS